jgi:hypothetical protein
MTQTGFLKVFKIEGKPDSADLEYVYNHHCSLRAFTPIKNAVSL